MDYSRIEDLFLKENYLLALNFLPDGVVPLRIMGREMSEYKYQAVSKTLEGSRTTTGTVAADTLVDSARLSLSEFNIDNVLRVTDCSHVYQVFNGIRPSAIRQYFYYPVEKSRKGLDVRPIFYKSPYGYVDGFESPYNCPSEQTELWIPKNVDVGFAWYNPLNTAEQIDLNILVIRYLVKVVRDVDTVDAVLRGKVPARIASLGGLDGFGYNARDVFNADFVPLDASREQIESALKEK